MVVTCRVVRRPERDALTSRLRRVESLAVGTQYAVQATLPMRLHLTSQTQTMCWLLGRESHMYQFGAAVTVDGRSDQTARRVAEEHVRHSARYEYEVVFLLSCFLALSAAAAAVCEFIT